MKVDHSGIGSVGYSSPILNGRDVKDNLVFSKSKAPFEGKVVTQKRNQRRRDSKRLKRLKAKGLLFPNATIADYHCMQASGTSSKELSDELSQKPQEEASNAPTAFEARRESLLKAIASGGIDLNNEARQQFPLSHAMEDTSMADEISSDKGKNTFVDDGAKSSFELQRKTQPSQTPAGGSTPGSSNENEISPHNATAVLEETVRSVHEIGASPSDAKAAAERPIVSDEAEVSSAAILLPTEIEIPPEEMSPPPHETEAEISEATAQKSGSHKRLRLDLESSKRLVYGSLGVRVPQTREDEIKLSAKLMENVKPLRDEKNKEQIEATPSSITTHAKEDDDNWKNKIVLMAVECCDEGVKLSTPPFPFVQRWDPQQQRKYNAGHSTRRGTKRKRNDDRYEMKRPRLSEMRNISDSSALASVSTETSAIDDPIEPSLEQQDQKVTRVDNDEDENDFSERFQDELHDSVPAVFHGGDIADLPYLPEDMSTCVPLSEVITNPGAVIAFKQLDMSETTNWQPKISDYRTAIVNHLADDGMLRMTLAKRDQSKKAEIYDQHTGERVYSKFEMPGFDDENTENPGVVEILFSELIEPKLIQAGKFHSATQQGGLPGVENATENEFRSLPVHATITEPGLSDIVSGEGRTSGVDEGVRQEIFDLIKEAGWRSSVRSSNGDDRRSEPNLVSSPNRPLSEDQTFPREMSPEEENYSRLSEQFNGITSSPPGQESRDPQDKSSSEGLPADSPVGSPVGSPKSQELSEIAETVNAHDNTVSNAPNPSILGNGYEAVDIKEEDYEGIVSSDPQFQPETDHHMSPQVPASPDRQLERVSQPVKLEEQSSKRDHVPAAPPSSYVLSSDNEFPTLENVFTQIRSSQAVSSQAQPSFEPRSSDDDLTYMAKSSFESTTTKGKGSRKGATQSSEFSGQGNIYQKQTLFKWEDSDEGNQTTPRASQRPVQSQIIDLTIASDPIDAPDDSDHIDEGTQLPVGPGWVKKTRLSSSRLGSLKPGERRSTRSTRSRSGSVY